MRRKTGFTLVELIVTIAVLLILASILLPVVNGFIDRANNAADLATARMLYSAASISISTNQTWLEGTYFADADGNTPELFQEYIGNTWPSPQKHSALSFSVKIEKDIGGSINIIIYRIYASSYDIYNQPARRFE